MVSEITESGFVNFADTEIEENKFADKLKLKMGEVARVGIIYPKTKGGALFVKKSLWHTDAAGAKYNIDTACIPEDLKIHFDMAEAKQKIGCLVCKYATDKVGKLANPLAFDILEWIFTGKKFNELKLVDSEYPLSTVDLLLKCTDEKFQAYSISPCKGVAYIAAKQDDIVSAKIEKEKMYDNLKKSLGNTYTRDELLEMVGKATAGGSVTTTDEQLNSVLDEI